MHVMTYAIFPEMLQNRAYSFSVLFSFSNRSAFFSKCFFMFEIPEMPHFPPSDSENGKMGLFSNFKHNKVGYFEKKARDQFQNGESTEIKYVRFRGILVKMHIPSHAKFILHILLRAFQVTPPPGTALQIRTKTC